MLTSDLFVKHGVPASMKCVSEAFAALDRKTPLLEQTEAPAAELLMSCDYETGQRFTTT